MATVSSCRTPSGQVSRVNEARPSVKAAGQPQERAWPDTSLNRTRNGQLERQASFRINGGVG